MIESTGDNMFNAVDLKWVHDYDSAVEILLEIPDITGRDTRVSSSDPKWGHLNNSHVPCISLV